MRLSEMLDRKTEEIKRPPLLPTGSYEATVVGHPELDDIQGKDGTVYDKVTFKCQVTAPIEVDEEDLAEYGSVAKAPFRVEYLVNTDPDEEQKRESAVFRIKLFLEACGAVSEDMTLQEGFAAVSGCSFGVDIGHRQDPNDSERMFLDVRRVYTL